MCELGIAQHSATGIGVRARDAFRSARKCIAGRTPSDRASRSVSSGRTCDFSRNPRVPRVNCSNSPNARCRRFEALDDTRSLARAWLLDRVRRGRDPWEPCRVGGGRGAGRSSTTAPRRSRPTHVYSRLQPRCTGGRRRWRTESRGVRSCSPTRRSATSGVHRSLRLIGGLRAQAGEFSEARESSTRLSRRSWKLGASAMVVVICGTVRADVELLAGDLHAAEVTLREQCEYLDRTQDRAHLAVRAAKLAETMYRQGRLDEAEQWADVSRSNAASDDQSAQLVLGPVEAKLTARRATRPEGRELAEKVVRLADSTDGLNQIAATRLALAEVLRAAELDGEADRAIEEAIATLRAEGERRRSVPRSRVVEHRGACIENEARAASPVPLSWLSGITQRSGRRPRMRSSGAASASRPTASTTSVRCRCA